MNHRDLVLSASKKAKFSFLALPEALQDEVVDGLDSRSLTLVAARDLIRERGYMISHEAIAGYYRAVRNERRLQDASQEVVRIFETFSAQPLEDNLRAFSNYLVAIAAQKLADGEVAMKVDLGKVLQILSKTGSPVPAVTGVGEHKQSCDHPQPSPAAEPGMSGELAAWLREQVLGVRKPEAKTDG